MPRSRAAIAGTLAVAGVLLPVWWFHLRTPRNTALGSSLAEIHHAAAFDHSQPLAQLRTGAVVEKPGCEEDKADCGTSPSDPEEREEEEAEQSAQNKQKENEPAASTVTAAGAAVEQTAQGTRSPAKLITSFDGLGAGFTGPQGTANLRNPSDNSLAIGPDHIVQIVNSRLAVFSKKGTKFNSTGEVLYGPVVTNTIFAGFGGQCEKQISGDAVVRYDQLAGRWLYILPVFRRPPGEPNGPYSMCYAISQSADPLGPYYRYEFKRPLFPDYPRPAIWPDGYYIPTSTGDNVIQKHACVADRAKMLQGLPATEQCIILDGPNFLNNADIDGAGLPPPGAPNIMIAAGGSQLRNQFSDDGVYVYQFHVDWETPAKTAVTGPLKITVAPYHYLCNGQLTNCVSQPGTERKLDAQGDKIMQRLVYRNINGRESLVGLHSVNTKAGGGGVRWYEFRFNKTRELYLHQQSTYAPDNFYRWMGSIGIDHQGNIGIGYSFGGSPHFAGQRFAARLADDPSGSLTFHETVLAEGAASQTTTLRWEDYTTTAMDPRDDCTFWYVGDYLKTGNTSYSSRIGSFRVPGCLHGTASGTLYFDRNHDGKHNPEEQGLGAKILAYSGVQTGKLLTDANGQFQVSLPADPAYMDPVLTITSPAHKGWTITRAPSSVRLTPPDAVTGMDIGAVCTIRNRGAQNVRYWLKRGNQALLQERESEWKQLVNQKLYLANEDGTRFTVSGSGRDAYDQLHGWLNKASGANPLHRMSVQLLVTALNVMFGYQDDNATVRDTAMNHWLSIHLLIERAIAAATGPERSDVEHLATLLQGLNQNSIFITPANPSGCPTL